MTRTAAVVGGGIGGLATAIGLRAAGWDVTVFERADRLPETGTGLGMWPSAMRALDRLGVGERARAAGRPQRNGTIRRPDGSVIATIDVDRIRRKTGEPVHLLSRPALLEVLADALPPGVVRFGAPVADVGALRAAYTLVVGADGIRSAVREAIFGDRHRLRHAGWMAWRGTADLDVPAGGEVWGRGVKFGLTPQEPGKTNWYAVISAPGSDPRPPGLDEVRRVFAGWPDPIPALLAAADPADVLRHDLHYLDPALPTYVDGNTVLLGDAAHAMTPDLGQGACQTLIDAAALADCLGERIGVEAGLARFDRLRRRPTQRIAAMATRVSRLTRMRHGLTVRDTIARAALAFGPPA
ncbi:MAG: NAD(P)-binding protein [Hamadaea sp.]|nr:NAD(P)-binding protein [Hamadaea sp.]